MTAPVQPGALAASGLRRAVLVLSLTEITSWGVLYYAFAVLSAEVVADTGWGATAVTGAFSAGLVVSAVVGVALGRRLDRSGPRRIMTAGSVVAAMAVVVVATAPVYPVFLAGWLLAGVAMAATLYPPAFASLTRWGGHHRVRALTTLTLVAGLASTVFAPLSAGLLTVVDWRGAYLVLAALLAVVTVPLHWWGLDLPWDPGPSPGPDGAGRDARARTPAFGALLVATTLTSFVVFAGVVNLVPMLVERGLSTGEAALGLAVGGLGQVAGRLFYARFARATGPVARLVLVVLAVGATTLLAAAAPPAVGLLLGVCAVLGVARGVFTLVQATAVSDRWGTAGFGHLNGILSAPGVLVSAVAPFAGAALAGAVGGQQQAFVVLALLVLLAVVPAARTGVRGGLGGTVAGVR